MPTHRCAAIIHLTRIVLAFVLIAAMNFDGASMGAFLNRPEPAALDLVPSRNASTTPADLPVFALNLMPMARDAYPFAPVALSELEAVQTLDAAGDLVADADLAANLTAAAGLSPTTDLTATVGLSTSVTSKLPAATTALASRLELAHARLDAQGVKFELNVVAPWSTGVALAIYRDLRLRRYRSTTGPDEGIDTHGLACYPACIFVPFQEVNVLAVDRWVAVLRHEYRHVIQATHNPGMAADFRSGPTGPFTSYGLFSEVCADYGINVAPGYRADTRMTTLKRVLGAGRQVLIDQACQGSKPSYDAMVFAYNQLRRSSRAFAALFPRYR